MAVPVCWGSTPRASTSFSCTKRKGGVWHLGCPRAGGLIKLTYKALKALKLKSALLFKTQRFHCKSEIWNTVLALTNYPRKPWSWCFVSDFVRIRKPGSLSGSGVALALRSDALSIEHGFGKSIIFLQWTYVPLRLKMLGNGCIFL